MNTTDTLHHVAVAVEELERAIEWYERMLDCQFERQFAIREAGIRIAFIRTPGGVRIELLERSGATLSAESTSRRAGADHICFKVPSIDEAAAEMRARGAEFAQEPKIIAEAHVKNFWIRDDSGGLIEYIEDLP